MLGSFLFEAGQEFDNMSWIGWAMLALIGFYLLFFGYLGLIAWRESLDWKRRIRRKRKEEATDHAKPEG